MTEPAKFWLEIAIVSADPKAEQIISECVGVQSIEDAFDEAEDMLRTAKEKWARAGAGE
jgi:hypothetical protein